MRWMGIEPTRRAALAVLAAGLLRPHPGTASRPDRFYLSSRRLADGRNAATIVNEIGQIVGEVPLEGRGHGAAVSPDGRSCAIFLRRPGTRTLILNRRNGAILHLIRARPDRHFFGHGFFSPNGRLMFATENDFDNARGVLGIYDVSAGYQRAGEFDSFGIGPHQCLLSRDGRTALVANGGIETHPDFPRQKLNLSSMKPNLARIDIRTGECLHLETLPDELHQVSLRHLAETPNGTVWVGGQYQGAAIDDIPLLAISRNGSGLRVVDTLAPDGYRARHYIGSVAANPLTGQVAVTAPRGGLAFILDGKSGGVLQRLEIADVGGVAPCGDDFLFSDGNGGLWHNQTPLVLLRGNAWDNHLTGLSIL